MMHIDHEAPMYTDSVSFGPQEIRDHYEGDEGPDAEWVANATDEQLRAVGSYAINDDRLWGLFHELLLEGVDAEMRRASE